MFDFALSFRGAFSALLEREKERERHLSPSLPPSGGFTSSLDWMYRLCVYIIYIYLVTYLHICVYVVYILCIDMYMYTCANIHICATVPRGRGKGFRNTEEGKDEGRDYIYIYICIYIDVHRSHQEGKDEGME